MKETPEQQETREKFARAAIRILVTDKGLEHVKSASSPKVREATEVVMDRYRGQIAAVREKQAAAIAHIKNG